MKHASLKNISIVFDTDVEKKIISYDSEKIERIMLNLLSNAIKFTEAGGSVDEILVLLSGCLINYNKKF